ncbi:hypothetical protein NA57DRAFT_51565 [Rhizodiscina lignyota]|uniref:RRM domain-containing protein n=1 Tax=Rhizodiscina lignyota TaxID=1504668 RepID=A0A9P4IUY2_9PEZI|nr:hypothetical protein NA57DRAFT_51565 [Rhizodiscina lignyota]
MNPQTPLNIALDEANAIAQHNIYYEGLVNKVREVYLASRESPRLRDALKDLFDDGAASVPQPATVSKQVDKASEASEPKEQSAGIPVGAIAVDLEADSKKKDLSRLEEAVEFRNTLVITIINSHGRTIELRSLLDTSMINSKKAFFIAKITKMVGAGPPTLVPYFAALARYCASMQGITSERVFREALEQVHNPELGLGFPRIAVLRRSKQEEELAALIAEWMVWDKVRDKGMELLGRNRLHTKTTAVESSTTTKRNSEADEAMQGRRLKRVRGNVTAPFSCLSIRGLNVRTSEVFLERVWRGYSVQDVRVRKMRAGQLACFIDLATAAEAMAAIKEFHGKKVEGQVLQVEHAPSRSQ